MQRNLTGFFLVIAAIGVIASALGLTRDIDALWGLLGVGILASWFPWAQHARAAIYASLFAALAGTLGVVGFALYLSHDIDALWGFVAIPFIARRFPGE